MGVGVVGVAVWGLGVDRGEAPGYVSLPVNREAGFGSRTGSVG